MRRTPALRGRCRGQEEVQLREGLRTTATKDPTNGCEQVLDVADHCGACDVTCDAHASCAGDEPNCVCDRPLIGDGLSCIGLARSAAASRSRAASA